MGTYVFIRNGITSDRLWNFCNARKKLKHASYQNVWRHVADNFPRKPQFFAPCSLYRPCRAIQSCEGDILKFHTVLEILAKNPKFTTHFFRGSENAPFPTASTIGSESLIKIAIHSFEKSRQIESSMVPSRQRRN